MARTVADVALMLDAMCGQHPLDPLSLEAPPRPFAEAAASPALPARVAYSADLDVFPVDPRIAKLIPGELATKHLVLPLKRDGRTLTVALADPTDLVRRLVAADADLSTLTITRPTLEDTYLTLIGANR